MPAMGMQTLMCPHWAPCHVGQADDIFMHELAPKVVKLFTQTDDFPRLDVAQAAATDLVVLRHHGISENYDQRGIRDLAHADTMAHDHASNWARLLTRVTRRDKVAIEGLNEPQVWDWGSEKAEYVAHYYAILTQLMASQGIRVVAGNLGVGWPGNGEPAMPPNSPPMWKPFEEMFAAIIKYHGFYGCHEYWYTNGAKDPWMENGKKFGGWGWWAGRFRTCPWNVPIIVTECGIDAHVLQGAGYFGWHGLPEPRDATYLSQLANYEYQCILDGRVVAFTPFTEDFYNPEWATYSTRTDSFHIAWLAHARAMEAGQYTLPTVWPLPQWASPPWTPTPAPIPTPPVLVPPSTAGWDTPALKQWKPLCEKYAALHDFSPEVVGATIITESNGNPNAVSTSGAVGLMQVMPREAGPDFSTRPTAAELKDPETNIKNGCEVLAGYKAANGGSLLRGLAAYFGGPAAGIDLGGKNATTYLPQWIKNWLILWKTELPFGRASAMDVSVPRWNAEEAVRRIEEAQDGIAAVRVRLLDNVIAPLYR